MSFSENEKSQLRLETIKLCFDLIKTLVVVGGAIVALQQLSTALEERQHARFQTTAEVLMKFGDPLVLDAVVAFGDSMSIDKTEENYASILARLTPARQLFVTWSACLAEGICLQGPSRELLCGRLIAYETAFEDTAQRFQKSYNVSERAKSYFGELEKCKSDFSPMQRGVHNR